MAYYNRIGLLGHIAYATTASLSAAVTYVIEMVATAWDERPRDFLRVEDFAGFTPVLAYVLGIMHFVWKPDTMAALAIDRLGHRERSRREASIWQRFKAFIERARRHGQWSAGEFLHGQPNRLMC